MPSERKPGRPPTKHKIVRGNKTWEVDPAEIRRVHGIDENGIRHTTLFKDSNPAALSNIRQTLAEYKAKGYTITENEYEYDLAIPDKIYKEREKKMHEDALARRHRMFPKEDPEAGRDVEHSFEELQGMSPQDFAESLEE